MTEEKMDWEVTLRPGDKGKISAKGHLKLADRGEVSFNVIIKREEFLIILGNVQKTVKKIVANIAQEGDKTP